MNSTASASSLLTAPVPRSPSAAASSSSSDAKARPTVAQRRHRTIKELRDQGYTIDGVIVTSDEHAKRREALSKKYSRAQGQVVEDASFDPEADIVSATAPDGSIIWYSCTPITNADLANGTLWQFSTATWANATFVTAWWAGLSEAEREAATPATKVAGHPIGVILDALRAGKRKRRPVAHSDGGTTSPRSRSPAENGAAPRAKRARAAKQADAPAEPESGDVERLCDTALRKHDGGTTRTLAMFAERNAATILSGGDSARRAAIMARVPSASMTPEELRAYVGTADGLVSADMLTAGFILATERCQERAAAVAHQAAERQRAADERCQELEDQVAELNTLLEDLREQLAQTRVKSVREQPTGYSFD